jgi:hypothetical protein
MRSNTTIPFGHRSFVIAALINADRADLADRVRVGKLGISQAAQLSGLRPRRKPVKPASRPRFVLATPPPFDPKALIG